MNGINENDMITKMIKELSTAKRTNGTTSNQVLSWITRGVVQRV